MWIISKLMFQMPLTTSLEISTPEDTARAFVQAIENTQHISKKIFNLGGGEYCRSTYKEFLSRSFKIFGLGKLNFPQKAFAEKNFHCGFYKDGDELNNILHFRKDTLESYFVKEKKKTPLWRKLLTLVFRKQIKDYLLKKSEPYKAFITNDINMAQRYFTVAKSNNNPDL